MEQVSVGGPVAELPGQAQVPQLQVLELVATLLAQVQEQAVLSQATAELVAVVMKVEV